MEDGNEVKREVRETLREKSHWVRWAGRIGYAARGTVYLLIAVLAGRAAFGARQVDEGARGALEQVVALPFGQTLLIIVAAGLVCHAVWRFIQAFLDTDGKGSDTTGYLARTMFILIGLIYLGLAFSAVKIFFGYYGGGNDLWTRSWTAWLLSQPFGQWLVGIIGAVIAGIGAYQFYKAFSTKFRKHLVAELDDDVEEFGARLGRYGLIARGIVFFISGGFFIFAGWSANAGRIKDFGSALQFVERQPYGIWLLGLLALGLAAYGVFMLFLAVYREMVRNRGSGPSAEAPE